MNLRIARMGMEHGKRCIRFAKAFRLDFFPRLVQPATGERYASPIPSYQHFSAMGSDPIETRYAARSELRCEKCASRFDEMREAS